MVFIFEFHLAIEQWFNFLGLKDQIVFSGGILIKTDLKGVNFIFFREAIGTIRCKTILNEVSSPPEKLKDIAAPFNISCDINI